jgi:RNA polymerase sigma-32 factor
MARSSLTRSSESVEPYLADIHQHRPLTAEEEQTLARACVVEGGGHHGQRLITANLRFVVKIAYEYRSYGVRMADLIQEGNLGLMRAVQRYDPDRGVRLISYAVWWIRAYIQHHILSSFSLVKLGTTQAQRKLFFSLARARRELDRTSLEHGIDSDGENSAKIACTLNVKAAEVDEMRQRMGSRDLSLDAPVGEDEGFSRGDFLADARAATDEELSGAQEQALLRGGIEAAVAQLDPRERLIIEQRVMTDPPATLKDLGEQLGLSSERTRQLERRAKAKLRERLRALAVELDWPTDAGRGEENRRPARPGGRTGARSPRPSDAAA